MFTLVFCGCGDLYLQRDREVIVNFINGNKVEIGGTVFDLTNLRQFESVKNETTMCGKLVFAHLENCCLTNLYKITNRPYYNKKHELIPSPLYELICSNGKKFEFCFESFDSDIRTRGKDESTCFFIDIENEKIEEKDMPDVSVHYAFVEIKAILSHTNWIEIEKILKSLDEHLLDDVRIYIVPY